MFSFQLDESTDVNTSSQWFVLVRYINSGDIKDEGLLCRALETITKADDVREKVSTFFPGLRSSMRKRVWGLYRWGTGYAGIEIMIPVECGEASTSSK